LQRLLKFLKEIKQEEDLSSWKLVYDRFSPAQESLREALCTLGNGYVATRGAVTESPASRIHYPGTYMAGVYNTLPTYIAGRTVYNEDLVNCPNWLFLAFRIGKYEWITPSSCKILSYRQELGMRRGFLSRKIRLRNRKGQTLMIETQRIVHIADPHRAALKYVIMPENYEGWIVIRSALDGTVQNTGVARYRQLNHNHLKPGHLGRMGKDKIFLTVKSSQSNITIAQAARVHIYCNGKRMKPITRILTKGRKGIGQEFGIYVRKRQRYEIEKIVSIYTSRDKGVRNPLKAAVKSVKTSPTFYRLFEEHKSVWADLWKRFDIRIEGDNFSQKVLRLHTFQLLQAASGHNVDIDAGLPARGLHGEAYRGHIFWDELFVMPLFDFRAPEISKAFLLYRYRRIAQARKYAKKSGYKGSMFPWQSGSAGTEETQVIHLNPMSGKWGPDYSRIQRHVSFAIAYNVWQHWKRTEDVDFFEKYAAEMMLSIAQFGASLTKYDEADKRFHSDGIMGPDEFHEKLPGASKSGFRDNAYTNILIVWTIMKALETLTILSKYRRTHLIKKLKITQKELQRWEDITKRMNIIIDDEGIISQFDGYFGLKELDWAAYRRKYGNVKRMDRILKSEGKSPNEYKVAKQADVIMMFYVLSLSEIKKIFLRLGYRFDKNMLKRNYEYYVKRTSHGSTLSKVVHGYVAHLIGKTKESWQWFQEILKSDIHDTQGGTTPEGIHTGVMGASIYITMRTFAGIDIRDDRIAINPRLPRNWRTLSLKFLYKKSLVHVAISKTHVTILIRKKYAKHAKIPIEINGKLYAFSPKSTHTVPYKGFS